MTNAPFHIAALRALKVAAASGALAALASCAHDAHSNLAMDTLDAVDTELSLVDLGNAAAERGDHTTAIQYFRSAHAKNLAYAAADGAPLLGLGQSLLAVGQYGEAAKVFVKAAKAGVGADALRGLAQAQLYLRQPDLAAESARRAVQLNPSDARATGLLGVALDMMGDHGAAAQVYEDAMSQFPDSRTLAANHGLSLIMTGDLETGIGLLEDVVRDPRAKARDRQNLALAYALNGDYDRAAALAAIDLDVSGVKANLLFADMLRAMSPRARLTALVLGAQAPKTDKSQNANAVYLKGDNAAWVDASVRRLVPAPDAADLAGVPPLMDPTGWAVQIAAYRKLEHLAPGWAYLSSKYASIIGGLEPRRSEVTHPPATRGPVGFFHRLNAGPLRTKQEALDICARMKSRGAQCWVRPPTVGEGRLPGSDDMVQSSEAEGAIVASQDYNAVVNQFARAMVMKARKKPALMAEELPAAPPAAVTPETPKTGPEPTPAEVVPVAAKPDIKPATVVPVAATPKPVVDDAPVAEDAPVIEDNTVVEEERAVEEETVAAEVAPQPAAEETQAARPSIPSLDAIEELAALEPAAAAPATMVMDQSASRLNALLEVFDAVEDADTRLPEPMPTASADVPSPGVHIPALKRFNDAPQNLSLVKHSGTVNPAYQNAGKAKPKTLPGVY